MTSVSSSSSSSSSPNVNTPAHPLAAGKHDREISDFILSLIEQANQPSTERVSRESLLKARIRITKAHPEITAAMYSQDVDKWKSEIFASPESMALSDEEKNFCEQLIDAYLQTPGYNKYQSYIRALWGNQLQGINFSKIHAFLKKIEDQANEIKRTVETERHFIKQNLYAQALEMHAEFKQHFSHESPPSFNPSTLQVECTLEQLAFASDAATRLFADMMRKAKTEQDVAFITRLVFMILCGKEAKDAKLPKNPVCIQFRETIHKKSVRINIELQSSNIPKKDRSVDDELHHIAAHLTRFLAARFDRNLLAKITRNPQDPSLLGQVAIYDADWTPPFGIESENCPIACADVHSRIYSQSHNDDESTSYIVELQNLTVNWAAANSIREKLVSLMVDLQSQPHRLTHPLTGVHLNAFADQVVPLFQPLTDEEQEDLASFVNATPSEVNAYRLKLKQAYEVKRKMLEEACSGIDPDLIADFKEFIDRFIDIFTGSPTALEFQQQLRALTAKKEYPELLLQNFYRVFSRNVDALKSLKECRATFRKSYEAAMETIISDFRYVREAFRTGQEPRADRETGWITAPFTSYRFAKQLFDFRYKWLVELADCSEDEAFASHVLACLLCGNNAPSLEKIKENPRCFLVREFVDESVEHPPHPLAIENGVSYNQALFTEIAKDNDLTETQQFENSVLKAIHLLIGDAIVRNRYPIKIGDVETTTQFIDESDLVKPFYLAEILDRYIEFLASNPDMATKIRSTPFAKFVKSHLSVSKLCQLMSDVPLQGVFHQAIMGKLIHYLSKLPAEYEDLVLVKLLELMSLVGQHVSLIVNKQLIRLTTTEYPHGESSYNITLAAHPDVYAYDVTLPACDALSCRGGSVCALLKKKIPIKRDTRVIYFEPRTFYPAEFKFILQIPSMSETDHVQGVDRPSLSFSQLALSALAPVSLMDSIASEFNAELVQTELDNNSSQEELQEAFVEMLKFLSTLPLESYDQNATLSILHPKLLAAYNIMKQMEIQQLVTGTGFEATKLKQFKTKMLDLYHENVKVICKKLEQKFPKENRTVVMNNFLNEIRKWFPSK